MQHGAGKEQTGSCSGKLAEQEETGTCKMTFTTKALCQKVAQWRKMSQHRPLFPESAEYKAFAEKLKELEKEISELINNEQLTIDN
jgi:hypothetical protein